MNNKSHNIRYFTHDLNAIQLYILFVEDIIFINLHFDFLCKDYKLI